MRRSFVHLLAAGATGAAIALSGAPAFAKTTKKCAAEYAANKAAIKASGQKKGDFVAACRAGTETIPTDAQTSSAPAQAAAPADPMAPKPMFPMPTALQFKP